MELLNKILLWIHIPAGFISLLVFIVPLFVKKGGKNHVKIGWLYVYVMWIVVTSSLLLSLINIYTQDYIQALFLGFLGILTAKPLWLGIAILQQKKGFSKRFKIVNTTLNSILFGFAFVNLSVAFFGNPGSAKILLIIFGLLGITVARDLLRKNIIPKNSNFIIEHIKGMVISGIAAYTAFFAFGGQSILGDIFVGNSMIILWVAPTIIGVVAIRVFAPKYRKKKLA